MLEYTQTHSLSRSVASTDQVDIGGMHSNWFSELPFQNASTLVDEAQDTQAVALHENSCNLFDFDSYYT
jgi:hypothetical protein